MVVKRFERDMSLLVFGWGGRKILVFPTSQGRFYEYEDNKMIAAVADKLDNGEIQIYCVDSVDDESWYNKWAHPYWRLQRHLQYERYIVNDVFPLMCNKNWTPYTAVTGCSFGAYHAVNFAFRHPDMVNACISMGGAFDIRNFMDGWSSEDVTSIILPTTWPTAQTGGSTTTCGPCSPPASGTCAGKGTRSSRLSCAPKAFGMNFTCGVITAITTGRGGGPWRGRTCENPARCQSTVAQRFTVWCIHDGLILLINIHAFSPTMEVTFERTQR